MAAAFPPPEPELAELSTCGDEADTDPEEDMEDEEDFAVELGTLYSCRRADGTYLDAEVVKMRTNKRTKREEYMVRYVGLTRRQTEWVDKSRLVLLKPLEDEDAEEGSDQEMSENGQTLQIQKPEEDEPETKKIKGESNETAAKSVVMAPGDFAEELTCLLCGKVYEDPVIVECGHDFCRSCVEKVWADEEFFTCPDCNQVMTEKSYARNRALANLVKKASAVAPIIPFKNCDEHQEQVELYCKDDGTMCCIICQDSLKHANHSFLPIVEAVGLYRTQLSDLINPLEEALTKTEELTIEYSEGIEQHQSKIDAYRHKVATEFEVLYCCLKERKETLLQQLQQQGKGILEKMETNFGKMAKNRENLKEAIVATNEKVKDTDCYSFLADIKPFFKKLKERKKATLSCRYALVNQELCHGEFNGPIQYIFWRQLKSLIGPIPECDDEVSPLGSETPEKAVESKVEPPGLKDADMETDNEPKPEESDEEEAAQVPLIPVEDFSDLMNKEHKEIWIVGDGYVSAVCRHVAKGPYADNLLFPKSVCNVQWLSNTKAWSTLFSKLKREVETQRKPTILFLHIGSYEFKHRGFDSLNTCFLNDLDSLIRLFPHVDIVLSTVLPRKEWMTSPVERNRKTFNSSLRRYAGKNRFQVVKHDDLETALLDRLEGGGDSFLNDFECELFFKSMREALLKELRGRKRSTEKAMEDEQSGSSLTSGRNTEPFRKAEQTQSPAERERELMKRLLAFSQEPQTIWIVGNIYIYKAYGHVGKRPYYGPHLGFKEYNWSLRWLGRTMRWQKMLPELQKSIGVQGMPSVIFLHLGSDDLELISYEALVNDMRNCLGQLTVMFPKVKLILSAVLPRAEWLGTHVEEWRRMFNTRLDRYAERYGFQMVTHTNLEQRLLLRFRRDRNSNLNFDENDLFVSNIRDSVLKTLMKDIHSVSEKPDTQERKSVSSRDIRPEKELHQGESTKPVQPSAEKRERTRPSVEKRGRTPSSAEQQSEADGSITGSKKQERSVELEEESQGSVSSGKKLILIVGNFIVVKACEHAFNAAYGMNLGFEEDKWNVLWVGKILKWSQLVPALRKYHGTYISAILIYMGSHDLGHTCPSSCIGDARHNINRLSKQFPKAQIILSSLLPQPEWMESNMDDRRKKYNSSIHEYSTKQGFEYVDHEELEEKLIARIKEGYQSNLLSDECEEFIKNVKDALVKATEKGDRIPVETAMQQDENSYDEPGKKLILIVGNFIVFKACEHAINAACGVNLGFEEDKWNVRWIGKVRKWSNLLPSLNKYRGTYISAIFVYMGTHDLCRTGPSSFIGDARHNLNYLSKQFPKAQIILSSLLPKAEWMESNLDDRRKKYNSRIHEYCTNQGFEYVGHEELEEKLIVRINEGDQSNLLSDECVEEFIKNVKDALVKATEKGDRIPVEPAPQQDEDVDDEPDVEFNEPEFEEPPIDPDNLPEHKIWIVGNTLIRAVHMHALNSSWGQNLGLERRNWTLHWLCKNMQWTEMFTKLRDTSLTLGVPSAVFIHLDNYDLGQSRVSKVIGDARSCMAQLSINFPKTQFIVSTILTKAEWVDKSMEGCRKKFNSILAENARKYGYVVVSHEILEKMRLARFKKGNQSVALLPNEREVFMKTLKSSLLNALLTDHMTANAAPFMARVLREPQEVVLANGATFYFVADIAERRPLNEVRKRGRVRKMRIGFKFCARPESDQSDSDQSSSDEDDSDRDKSDREDRDKADLEEADKEKSTGESSLIQEEAEQDKERTDADERRAAVQERAEQDVEMMDTDETRSTVQERTEQDVEMIGAGESRATNQEGAEQNQERMECDPKETLPENEGAPGQPEQPPVDSPTNAPVVEKSGPKQVWIIGCSFLCRAKQHAYSKPYWQNLGFDEENLTIHWMGCIGMRWESLAEELNKAKRDLGIPSIIVIHLGGNDMGRMPYKLFSKNVKYDFRQFPKQFQKTQVIFSTILPRAEWLMTPVEQVRMKFNESILKCSWSLGFHVLVHNNIEETVKARFKTGRGNDLSDMEYHLFLTSIRDSVQKVLTA